MILIMISCSVNLFLKSRLKFHRILSSWVSPKKVMNHLWYYLSIILKPLPRNHSSNDGFLASNGKTCPGKWLEPRWTELCFRNVPTFHIEYIINRAALKFLYTEGLLCLPWQRFCKASRFSLGKSFDHWYPVHLRSSLQLLSQIVPHVL